MYRIQEERVCNILSHTNLLLIIVLVSIIHTSRVKQDLYPLPEATFEHGKQGTI
jgi:hypothetical protein